MPLMRKIWLIISGIVLASMLAFTPVLADSTTASQTDLQKQLSDIQAKLQTKKSTYDDLQSKITVYKDNLKSKEQEKLTLSSEIEVLDQNTELTKAEIDQTQIEIDSLGLQIDQLQIQINSTESDITDKKNQVSSLIRDLFDYDQKTYLEIALSNTTLSDFSSQVEYTENLNNQFKENLDSLHTLKDQLQQHDKDLQQNQQAEQDKKVELLTNQQALQGEADFKNNLLSQVQDDEAKFQQLVSSVQAEQSQDNTQITQLENSARATLDKLNQLKGTNTNSDTFTPSNDNGEFDPMWPVTGVITTLFHDPNYIFRQYFQHDAIDIATPQGTPLKAADDGVVAVVHFDGSPSYAYIMIIHANNFATIYGHVSAAYVEPDQVVTKGQIIALSGAYPGTPGAGPFTTGPHLHFGVRLNGIPVDPLLYLPAR